MGTDGVVWMFRYRSAGGTYKWEFIGGGYWEKEVDATEAITAAYPNYSDSATVGPSITVPLAGEYVLEYGLWPVNVGASAYVMCAPKIGAAAPQDIDAIGVDAGTGNADAASSRQRRKTITPAGTLVKLQYTRNGSTAQTSLRFLSVIPIRVG